mgnify:CR=1 FL=1
MMKRTILYFILAAGLLCACAKDPKGGLNDDAYLYFESWIQVNHPDAEHTALGAYILEDTPGTGAAPGDPDLNPYIRVTATSRSLSGTIQTTTEAQLAKQLGTYDDIDYYGPEIWDRSDNGLAAGLEEAISTMRVGGSRTVAIPGWLLGYNSTDGSFYRYDTAQEYLDKVSASSATIYELTLEELIPDTDKWEADSCGRYISRLFPGRSVLDSLEFGIYYFRTGEPSSTESFHEDTTLYVNYIGRRLDGTVFDTNIADTAKFYGLYSASSSYGPAAVSWYGDEESHTDITFTSYGSSSSSSVITGFSYALDQMHPHEQGTAIFISDWGYGTSGSGITIPGYSPLRFDFQIVDKP